MTSSDSGGDGERFVVFVANRPFALLRSRLAVMDAFRDAGWRVLAAAAVDGEAERLREHGVTFFNVSFRRRRLSLFQDIRALFQLLRIYRRHRPVLVHHFHAKPILLGNLAARLVPGLRVVNTVTGLGKAFVASRWVRCVVGWGYRLCLSRSDMTVFQNPDDHQLFLENGWVERQRSCLILGSGVDLQRFRPVSVPQRAGELRVVMVTRLLYSKGVREFVDAAAECLARLAREKSTSDGTPGLPGPSEVRFQLAGELDPVHPDAVDRAWIDEQVRRGSVEFLDYVENMEQLLPQATIFVFPSYYPEGVPRVLLEAAACGVPVISTDLPGCREAFLAGETGLAVPPRDAGALADAVLALLADPELRKRMGQKARSFVEERFDLVAVGAQYAAVYESLGASVPVGVSRHEPMRGDRGAKE